MSDQVMLGANQPEKPVRKGWLWIIILVVLVLSAGAVYYFVLNKPADDSTTTKSIVNTTASSGKVVIISDKVLANKFGWLGGGTEDAGDGIVDRSGLWIRPHPGALVWDMMQKSKDGAIDFTLADEIVNTIGTNDLGILATIWPFADWDQINLANAADCKVSSNDEFLPKNDKKGRGVYLPNYRCNPSDWAGYQKFVEAVVERYDGDGVSDMPGLKMPIKYWEVMNEPDLQYQNNAPAGESDRLTFYKQGPAEYGTLLIKTSKAIRSADPEAKILIAGAAGGDSRMLNFYKEVFKNSEVATAFDLGNVHCISNDRATTDFNVTPYKNMLSAAGVTGKTIWVTEAEAVYSQEAEKNFLSTKASVAGAIAAGAERIFFTRDDFGDNRTDMSKKSAASSYPSAEKYREIISAYE